LAPPEQVPVYKQYLVEMEWLYGPDAMEDFRTVECALKKGTDIFEDLRHQSRALVG
jgi:hypothetical protein